jgi:integrase
VKARPVQDIRIWNIQDRSGRPGVRKPRVVRWVVDGKLYSQAFRTKAEADRFRSRLLLAQHDGEQFDPHTGRPASWLPQGGDTQLHVWARRWVAEQWPEWQPRTRREDVYSLSRFIPLTARAEASDPPAGMRRYLCDTLRPEAVVLAQDPCERWLSRWVPSLAELDRPMLAEVSRLLGIGDEGQALANETVRRCRRVAHSCIRRAVELEQLAADPWPPTQRGRSRRKVNRAKSAVDVRRLPGPATAVAIIDALRSHQPGSRTYQAMTAVVNYAGLRPSEVVMLRPRALCLPSTGWGRIAITEADIDWDEPGDPKTGNRTTPIPPRLVDMLRTWVKERELGPDDLLFRTRRGNRPSQSNWSRALKRACENAGHPRIRVYDFRHANATMMIKARVSLAEAARRLGHSVETLVSTYIGAMEGDDTEANTLVDRVLATTREQILIVNGEAGTAVGFRQLIAKYGNPALTMCSTRLRPGARSVM